MFKNLMLVLCGLSLFVAMLACGSATPGPIVTSLPVATAAPAGVGQRVESGGIALTVNGITGTATMSDIFSADAGKVFVVVDVIIENTSRESAAYNPLYFKVKDADNFEYNITIGAPDPSLLSGDLLEGEKVRGNIAFEVPTNAKGLVVSYEPQIIFGGYNTIRIAIGDAPPP